MVLCMPVEGGRSDPALQFLRANVETDANRFFVPVLCAFHRHLLYLRKGCSFDSRLLMAADRGMFPGERLGLCTLAGASVERRFKNSAIQSEPSPLYSW